MSAFSWYAIRLIVMSIFAICVSGFLYTQGISITQTAVKFLILQSVATIILIIPLTDFIMKAFRKNER